MRFLTIAMVLALASSNILAMSGLAPVSAVQAKVDVAKRAKSVAKAIASIKRVLLRNSAVPSNTRLSAKLARNVGVAGLTAMLLAAPVTQARSLPTVLRLPSYRQLLPAASAEVALQQNSAAATESATPPTDNNSSVLIHLGWGNSKTSLREVDDSSHMYYDIHNNAAKNVGVLGASIRAANIELKVISFSSAAAAGEEKVMADIPDHLNVDRQGDFGNRYDIITALPVRIAGFSAHGLSFIGDGRGYDRATLNLGPYLSIYTRHDFELPFQNAHRVLKYYKQDVVKRHRRTAYKLGLLWQLDLHLVGNINLTYLGTHDALSTAEGGSLHLLLTSFAYELW